MALAVVTYPVRCLGVITVWSYADNLGIAVLTDYQTFEDARRPCCAERGVRRITKRHSAYATLSA
ncbi:MAG: WSD1 family O-acyltransferase [Mycobacteriaceae bacterium]|nr:WSD1 family O-acyltransferase [Mycobacteriaceae bacterium]